MTRRLHFYSLIRISCPESENKIVTRYISQGHFLSKIPSCRLMKFMIISLLPSDVLYTPSLLSSDSNHLLHRRNRFLIYRATGQLNFSTFFKSLSGAQTKIFLTCKLNQRKLEVRNSSKNFFFSKKYHSSIIFFVFASKHGFKSLANIFLILQAPLRGISTKSY